MALPRRSFHRGLALLVAAAFFMENLDGTIIQAAAPTMAVGFGVQPEDVNLAMVSYLVGVAVCIPASGWLAARYGIRRVFLIAVALFTLSSLACAIAPTLGLLTAARAVQGVGGALMIPVGRLAVLRTTSTSDLLDAVAYLTWPALLAPVVAPFLGGLITETIGWPWIFLLNLPIGAAIFVAGLVLVPRGTRGDEGRFDWSGFGSVAGALLLVTCGAELMGAADEASGVLAGVGVLLAGVVVATAGIRRMRRHADPLFDWSSLDVRSFRVSNVSGGVYRLMITGLPFLFTLLFQVSFGWSAVTTGLIVMMVFVGNVAIKPATTPLIRRFGFRRVLIASNAVGVLTLLAFAGVRESTPVALILLLLVVSGIARSVGFSAYNTLQFVDLEPARLGGANTLSATIQQGAIALGIAVVAVFVRLGAWVSEASVGNPSTAYPIAFVLSALLMLIPLRGAISLHPDTGSAATRREAVRR